MFERRQAIEIVDKLIELTQHSEITWSNQVPNSYMVSQDSKVDTVYTTEYLGRTLRAYTKDYKYYHDELNYSWDKEVIIEFIGDNQERLGAFPRTPNASELMQAIQYQNPDIKNFYNDIFKK